MKIAIILFQATLPGGSQRQALSLAKELTRLGHKVIFYAEKLDRSHFLDLLQGFEVRVLPAVRETRKFKFGILGAIIERLKRDYLTTISARRIAEIMDKDFDIVNGHDYEVYKTGYFYKKINPTASFVWTMNEIPFSYMPKGNLLLNILRIVYNFYKKLIEKKFFKAIDIVVTLNDFDARWARRLFKLKTELVASGCDFNHFYNQPKSISCNTVLRLLTLAVFATHRRFEDTLRVVSYLRDKKIDARALIFGSFGNPESPYARYLFDLRKKLDLDAFVELRFDTVNNKKLKEIYAAHDIFVFPTYIGHPRNGYGWGLAAFEAMAAGLVVALYSSTASTRLMKNDEHAIIVHPLRPDLIAERIAELVINPERFNTMAKNGQDLVRTKILWENYAKSMLNIFNRYRNIN